MAVHEAMRVVGARRNCCVEACRVGVEVAKILGYAAVAVPMMVRVRSAKAQIVLPEPVGFADLQRPRFPGHLVLHFPVGALVSDPTADQFHYPIRGLHVPEPISFPSERESFAGVVQLDLPTGTTIAYHEMAGNSSYRSAPGWTDVHTVAVGIAVRRLGGTTAARKRSHVR